MVASNRLGVWLNGEQIAEIFQVRGRLRLAYSPAALSHFDLGIPLLSVALPLSPEPFTHVPVFAFLEGLLPEGDARQQVARDVGVSPTDTFALIGALGRDCAGAITIQPASEPPPPRPPSLPTRGLTSAEISALLDNLQRSPLGVSDAVRISLAGVQEKLLLTRLADGSWSQPLGGIPSTHIWKPPHLQSERYPLTVENEAFCMRLAKHMRLPVADVEVRDVDGRKVLVVERFDRLRGPDGSVSRIHQEDFCQSTSTLPANKYEENGGPSLRRVAEMLRSFTEASSLETLLKGLVFNVLIGNCDAHAKNLALLHESPNRLRLAPFYDLMSTAIYGEDRLAMYVDSVQRLSRVDASRIVEEAASWRLPTARAKDLVAETLSDASSSIRMAKGEVPDVPSRLLDFVRRQQVLLESSL